MKLLIDRIHRLDDASMVLWEDILNIVNDLNLVLSDYAVHINFWEVHKVTQGHGIMQSWCIMIHSPLFIPDGLMARLIGDIQEEYDLNLEIIHP